MTNIVSRYLKTAETPHKIVIKTLTERDNDLQTRYNTKYLQEKIRKHRKSNNYTFSANSDIPDKIKTTLTGADFLLYDTGFNDENRINVFNKLYKLIHFKNIDVFIVDGTFKVCPSDFCQLFSIQCNILCKTVPLVYCFMKKKTLSSYVLFFTKLKEEYDFTSPKQFTFDFTI
jgi:hypothetical protein